MLVHSKSDFNSLKTTGTLMSQQWSKAPCINQRPQSHWPGDQLATTWQIQQLGLALWNWLLKPQSCRPSDWSALTTNHWGRMCLTNRLASGFSRFQESLGKIGVKEQIKNKQTEKLWLLWSLGNFCGQSKSCVFESVHLLQLFDPTTASKIQRLTSRLGNAHFSRATKGS